MKKDENIKYTMGMFDLIKGVAMLVIIMQHTFTLDGMFAGAVDHMGLEKYILGFIILLGASLMPFFIEISGFDFVPQKNVKRFKRKVIQYIKPYIVVMCCTVVLNACLHYLCFHYIKGAIKESLKVLGGFCLGLPVNYTIGNVTFFSCGPVWFLLAITWGYIFLNVIYRIKSEKMILLAVICAITLGIGLEKTHIIFWCIPQGLIATGYLYMGSLVRKKKLLEYHWNWIWTSCFIASMGLATIGIIKYGRIDNMADSVWNFGILSVIADGIIGISLLRVFLYFNQVKFSFLNVIKTIGRYSLYVFCVHSMELISVPWYVLQEKLPGTMFEKQILIFVLRCIFIFSLTYLLRNRHKLINKLQKG